MSTKKISEITDKATSGEISTAKIVAAIPSGDGHVTKYIEGGDIGDIGGGTELVFFTNISVGAQLYPSYNLSSTNVSGTAMTAPPAGKTYKLVNMGLAGLAGNNGEHYNPRTTRNFITSVNVGLHVTTNYSTGTKSYQVPYAATIGPHSTSGGNIPAYKLLNYNGSIYCYMEGKTGAARVSLCFAVI